MSFDVQWTVTQLPLTTTSNSSSKSTTSSMACHTRLALTSSDAQWPRFKSMDNMASSNTQYPIRCFRRREVKPTADPTGGSISKPMRHELERLVSTGLDPFSRKLFQAEMESFLQLYIRYMSSELTRGEVLDWQKVSAATEKQIGAYEKLPPNCDASSLRKLVVLKVNGGLGTTMDMGGAKSALEVQGDLTFLDIIIRQVEHLNKTERVEVPLLLMTSFNTEEDTLRIVKTYANRDVKITTFNQSRYPRLTKDSLLPLAKSVQDGKASWYPPGHGDLYNSLHRSGVLDRLIGEGKEYLFISNSDNLGAVVDQRILQYMVESDSEFVMEVTDKTKRDIKGGTLINYDGTIRLMELAQVPQEFSEEFKSVRKFKVFNTNNLWINLRALKRVVEKEGLDLEIIANNKTLEDGQSVLQLETAAGSAIRYFKNAHGINVPRRRFLPVKNCSDLLLVKSNLFMLVNGHLVMNENRVFGTLPVVKLGAHFKKIQQFHKRFKQIPNIIDLDHLTVTGDVYFGRNVTLRGTVIIVANEGQRIDIPDGCILENHLLSGNLNITEL